ncbi:MAG: replicative DNA helicase [Xanthomonadaceae bacterium]|nr:replicative DNA helicase [Xanthomonadaceae bacterium]MDE2053693.1 replicative DNA helicase [Xanthomonadaceae bacterium]MDE2223695.1 replicative DNA helicase [Xanthomonadaceae bacterium]MDE2498185.1 replicative DNA helicase [Xanthomonadaceae bacterium]
MSAVFPEPKSGPPRVDVLRVPPHSIEAEQSVLGGLMLVGEAWDQVADRITEEDFYRREHRLIFRAIGELAMGGKPCDAVTLGEWFERHGETANIGGVAYLAELANNTPSAANIAAYADIVRDKAVLRKLIEAGTQIAGDGFNPEGRNTPEILEAAEQRVFKIAEAGARGRKQVIPVRQSVKEAVELLAQRYANRGQLNGLTTGFKDLDDLTSGLQRQDLVIVAGRPSMGKTAFALNIAEAVAMRAKQPVLVFSMEMSASQLAFRLISSMGRINQKDLRSGELAEEEWPRVSQAASLLSESKIFIDDTPALSPGELRSRARRMMREHGLGLVILDYLQLMQVPGNKENRATEISEISRNLKAMAKELDVPVIALSQLNRALEQRNDKRPVMSDLRESGAIEQDADLILFIYRDEVYNKESNHKGIAEIIIGKQRNGPIDTIKLTFLGQYTKFENYAPEAYIGSME